MIEVTVNAATGISDHITGLVIGAALTGIVSWILLIAQNRAAANRQQKELDHNRQMQWDEWDQQRVQRAELFQRDTLTELQERIGALVTAAAIVEAEKLSIYYALAAETRSTLFRPTERFLVNRERYREAWSRAVVLGARVQDEIVREDLRSLIRITDDLAYTMPGQFESADAAKPWAGNPTIRADELKVKLNIHIGELLKKPTSLVDAQASSPISVYESSPQTTETATNDP